VASFYVENFGCRATQADGAAIERQFQERGLERAVAPEQAEIVVLNTCTVTAAADQDARAAIRRIHRKNPGCQIVVTGCYAQRAPEEIGALPGVSQVVGNSHKHRLAEIAVRMRGSDCENLESQSTRRTPAESAEGFVPLTTLTTDDRRLTDSIFVSDIFAHTELLAAPVFDAANERTRPNLKVQDGCDNRCSFCVIPYVRGQSRSLPLDEVLREVNVLVEAGYKEVVISGINLGRWGRDLRIRSGTISQNSAHMFHHVIPTPSSARGRDLQLGQVLNTADSSSQSLLGMTSLGSWDSGRTLEESLRFEDLVRTILAETSLEKLRISSVEPMDWSDELIRLMAESPRIAKHAHVPMQSGSDAVLRRMHRKYRPWHYREKIEKIRAAMPTAAIGADVMAGFPGETDAEFEETRRMVEELPFTYLHVFTYSPRPRTPAAEMHNQVPVRVARERSRILRDLAAEKKLAFMRSFVGKTLEAITLNTSSHRTSFHSCHSEGLQARGICFSEGLDTPFTEALTDNYLKLRLQGRHEANRWLTACVEEVEDGSLTGVAR
jgi:threonylcarbamoyladenosine tRNA methylthiotransferase MtaB